MAGSQKRRSGVVILGSPRPDGACSVVRTEPGRVILSTGEDLIVRYEKLQALCEQLCQERAAVTIRDWWTPDGMELVEIHRVDRTGQPPWRRSMGEASEAF